MTTDDATAPDPASAADTLDPHAVRAWFDDHERPLPWRRPGTGAWAILLCEVMSQQTPVARVIPAWEDWLRRWPRPADLAAAPTAEVLRAWGKLGYPRRALRLQECARVVCERHGGEIPSDVDELLALPGIGAYTARAVAAFAYGTRVPVVDTNVRRVLARCVDGEQHARRSSSSELAEMEARLPDEPSAAVRFAAGVMELGALVCTARTPECEACPLAGGCRWLAAGRPVSEAPRRPAQKFAGTDRQVRGLLLDVLRDGHDAAGLGPAERFGVPRERLDAVWPDAVQRDRALDSLLADGLLVERDGLYALPD